MKNRAGDQSKASVDAGKNKRGGIRSRVIAVAVLLLLTVAGGLAAKSGTTSQGNVDPVAGSDALAFSSASNGAAGGVHFDGRLDRGSVLQAGDGEVRMELVLSADEMKRIAFARVPTDLVVVLDRSGSMGGKPLADAIASVQELVARLGNEDRLALVTYASDVRLAIPLQAATAANRARWHAQVAGVRAGGGTNMASGIDLATATIEGARLPGRTSRVILLSDGHANEGDHSPMGLRVRAARAAKGEYVLSTVGVGLDFDEVLMTALADSGTGNFYYVRDGSDLGEVFAGEFDSARDTVASAVTVEIELAPGVELLDAAGYPIERDGRIARFRPGALFAGQSRRVWLTLAGPTAETGDFALGDFRMTYREPGASRQGVLQTVGFDRTPQIACVAAKADFLASLDEATVVRSINEDGLASLKQNVARAVSEGRFDRAQREIDRYRSENEPMYDSLGLVQEEQSSFAASAELEAQVVGASKASSPAARKALSKTLSAEGKDGRRVGAKY